MIPTACPVGKIVVISPSAGATSSPTSGSIAIPFPITPEEKTWSGTSLNGSTLPVKGLFKVCRAEVIGSPAFACLFSN